VTLCLAQSLHPILASKLVEVTFLILPHDLGALVPEAIKLLEERCPEYDALLVGPGLGSEDATVQFVHRLLDVEVEDARRQIGFLHTKRGNHADGRKTKELPALVIDADGLNALARAPGWWESLRGQAVLTPHPGEMSRLRSCSIQEVEADRVVSAQEAAQEWGQTVVLKGPHTVIAAPGGRIAISPFANPGLATAGTGDVLAGSIVGFLAQGLSAYDAARAGVYIHGAAGEMATAALGNAGTVAGDLLPLLPRALNTIQRGC
jgi:NAD(P)H-hydrate epimerase